MKKYIVIFMVVAIVVAACTTQINEPETLGGLTSELESKNAEIRQLQSEVAELEAKIQKLNPNLEENRRLVTVSPLVRSDFKRYARVQGAVESDATATVSSEMPGRLTSVVVEEGDYVRQGQLIATIDTLSVIKNREELETQLELATDIYERQKRLWDQNIGSEVQYLQAKNNVERIEKSIESVEHNLTKSWVYSPISGVIDHVNLKPGQLAQPGLPIVTILDTRNIKVVADVPESYLGKVARGERVEVLFPALDMTTTAPVSMIGRKIDPANRTFIIEVQLSSKNGQLKPNLLAEVLINDYVEENVLVVSQELVQQEVGGKSFVMVVDEGDRGTQARRAYITTGAAYEGDVVVTEGLEDGDVLIVDGSRGLSHSDLIEIQSPTEDVTNGE